MGITLISRQIFFGIAVVLMGSFALSAVAMDAKFAQCIQNNENPNGSPSKVNQFGYSGLYQMGVNYAAEGGLCTNANKIPLMNKEQDWATFDKICDFKGDVAKTYNISSYSDLINSRLAALAQKAILINQSDKTWARIVNEGLDRYVGQTIGGVVMTKETMVAMAHLKGYGGMEVTLKGGVVADGNGTTTINYASCLSACMSGSTEHCSLKSGASSPFTNVCSAPAATPTTPATPGP